MIAQMLRAKEKDTYLVELSCCADFDRKKLVVQLEKFEFLPCVSVC